ncbi:MAG TPA: hypothetical protein VFF64_06620 [Candidatus Eremiobacteraceae bacterium]|nr:hypothetical protein [Candidatus Eremiobacteraceae bacterium]
MSDNRYTVLVKPDGHRGVESTWPVVIEQRRRRDRGALRRFRWFGKEPKLRASAVRPPSIVTTTGPFSRPASAHVENIRASAGIADLPLDDWIEFGVTDWAGALASEAHAHEM